MQILFVISILVLLYLMSSKKSAPKTSKVTPEPETDTKQTNNAGLYQYDVHSNTKLGQLYESAIIEQHIPAQTANMYATTCISIPLAEKETLQPLREIYNK